MSEKSAAPAQPGATSGPPLTVKLASLALLVSGIAAVIASLTLGLGSVQTWLRDGGRDTAVESSIDKLKDVRKDGPNTGDQATKLNAVEASLNTLKKQPSDGLKPSIDAVVADLKAANPGASKDGKSKLGDIRKTMDDLAKIDDTVSKQRTSLLMVSIVTLVALGIAAAAAYRGKFWSRWAALGLWVLATFTGSLAGLGSVIGIAGDIPLAFKAPAFIAGLGLVAAVILTNIRPSVEYFNRNRPVRPGGAPQRRGLFSPPPPRQPKGGAPVSVEKSARATPDRARTKQRASAESAARGAELARARAKASKSRRTPQQ
ncbi:hypothetical protein [Jatrophihabitans fulvus]